MAVLNELTQLECRVPSDLKYRGRWIDNGVLSNMHRGDASILYRSVRTKHVEQAYVAAKNPDAIVSVNLEGAAFNGPFHALVARLDPFKAKRYGRPVSRGGLVDTRKDWEEVALAAMWSFQVMKYAPDTKERAWLLSHKGALAEWSNWGDSRWGLAVGKDGSARGRNALGRLLTVIRKDISAGKEPAVPEEKDWAAFQQELWVRLNDPDLLAEMAADLIGRLSGGDAQPQLPL